MNQEQLHYRVTGDAKGFKGAINQSQKSLTGFQSQIKKLRSIQTKNTVFTQNNSLNGILVGGAAFRTGRNF